MNPDFILDAMRSKKAASVESVEAATLFKCPNCEYTHHLRCINEFFFNKCKKCNKDFTKELSKSIVERKRDKKSEEKGASQEN